MTKIHYGTAENPRFPALDGLRGVAAMLVILHHLAPRGRDTEGWWFEPFNWLVQIGWVGVDLFFALSGFLITGILVRAKGATNFFRAFYWHRALRILPIWALLLFIFTIVVPWLFPAYYLSAFGPGNIWPYWTFMSNMRLLNEYFGMTGNSIINVTWTLSIEEQFYVFWSVVVRFVSVAALLPVAVALLIGSIITRNLMIDLMPNYAAKNGEIFLFTLSHLDGLFIGAVARMLYDMPAWERRLRAFSTTAPLWAGLILAGLLIDYLIGSWNTANWEKPSTLRFGFAISACCLPRSCSMASITTAGFAGSLMCGG